MVEVETYVLIYASNVINLLTIVTTNHHLSNLILDCKTLLQQLGDPLVKYVTRESNKCVDLDCIVFR